MLRWAFGFLVLAMLAAFLAFGGATAASAGVAKWLFYSCLVAFAVTLVLGLLARGDAAED